MSDEQPHFSPPLVQPMAAIPISYSSPVAARHRPGIITAIGVLSIIVACLTCMTSLLSGCESFGFYTMSRGIGQISRGGRAGPGMLTTTFNVHIATPATQAPRSDANGLSPADQSVVKAVVRELEPELSPARSEQLQAILAESGKSVFPTGGEALTPDRVKTSITVHRTVTGSGEDDPGCTILITNWGQLKLFDQRAVFTPSDSGPVIEAAASGAGDFAATDSTGAAPQPAPKPVLTAGQIRQVIAKVQKAALNKLDAAQIASLKRTLEDPSQTLVTPNMTISPVTFVNVLPDGSAWITLQGGVLQIDPRGATNANPFGNAMQNFGKIDPAPCLVGGIASLLSVGLGIYLFVAGILVFRQSPSGGKMHLIYAWIKIPLAIIGTAAIARMNYQFYNSITGLIPGNPFAVLAMMFWIIVGAMALVYPIGLLMALRSQTLRYYYNTVRST